MYTYIEKIAEILQQIQMEVVDSKVPVFSSFNNSSRHKNMETVMEDTRYALVKSHKHNTHSNKGIAVLIILKGCMLYFAAMIKK